VSTPHLNPSQTGRYSICLPRRMSKCRTLDECVYRVWKLWTTNRNHVLSRVLCSDCHWTSFRTRLFVIRSPSLILRLHSSLITYLFILVEGLAGWIYLHPQCPIFSPPKIVISPSTGHPENRWRFYVGARGHRPPHLAQAPKIFNWFYSNFA